MYKKEIKINIADRFIGQDVTGRCLINKYKIYKVTDYFGLEVFKSQFDKVSKVDDEGNLEFFKLDHKVNYKIYVAVYNSYRWFYLDEYLAQL